MTDADDRDAHALTEHAVIARYRLTDKCFGSDGDRRLVAEAGRALREAIEAAGVGEFEGHELTGDEAVLSAYGPDADALFAAMAPVLRSLPLRPAYVSLRYGSATDPGAAERRVELR